LAVTVDEQTRRVGQSLRSAADGGRRSGRWILIAVAAFVLAVTGCVASDRHDGFGPPSGIPTTVVGSGSTAPSPPACLPRILESGFSVTRHVVHYGVIARSDCPEVTFNNVVSVRVLDADGKKIDGQDESLPELVVLLPGQELGGAGAFYMTNVMTVGRVDVEFTGASAAPASAFASWPTSVRVADLHISKPDDVGRTTVTGRIVTEPDRAALCWPHTGLIVRDVAGKIIYGQSGVPQGGLVSFDLAMPARADLGKVTVYVALGQVGLSLDPVSTAACRT
jgi:hypothetical protein